MIEDKVVIIAGASSGIGAASAKLLAARGGKVVLGARPEKELKQIADEIDRAGTKPCTARSMSPGSRTTTTS